MNNKSKIELKSKNSNNNVIINLEKISNGNGPKINYSNFKNLNKFLMCIACVLVGICITPTLTQKPNKNVFVKYDNPDSQSTSDKEKSVKNNSHNSNKNNKKPKHEKFKYKKPKNKHKLNNYLKVAKPKTNTIFENQNTNFDELDNSTYRNNIYGNSVSNVLNGNFLAEENNWFYYIDYRDSNYVYRTNILNGTTELILDIPCKEINILKGKLYAIFLNPSNKIIIYDIQTNQYKESAISQNCLNSSFNYTISCDENGIYRNFIDDSNKPRIEIYAGDIEKCVLFNQTIYFIESNNLYSIDLDGNNNILIKENVQHFAVTDSQIYYISDNQLYSIDEEDPLYDICLGAINIYNNTIYFSNENDNGKLYSINMITSEITKISDEIAEKICVTEHKIAIITPENKIVFI